LRSIEAGHRHLSIAGRPSRGNISLGGFRSVEEFLQKAGNALWWCTLCIFFLHPASDQYF